jgi:hypothetical protein
VLEIFIFHGFWTEVSGFHWLGFVRVLLLALLRPLFHY